MTTLKELMAECEKADNYRVVVIEGEWIYSFDKEQGLKIRKMVVENDN